MSQTRSQSSTNESLSTKIITEVAAAKGVSPIDLHQLSGYEILEELKNEPELRLIPIIVLSESKEAEDSIKSYTLNANAHIQKPDDPDEFERIVKAIGNFWLATAQLPPI